MKKPHEKGVKIICVFGLPGTGKTTIARLLAHRLGYRHLNTDIIRTLMGKRSQYDANTKEAIYDLLIERASQDIQKSSSVIIDGTFSSEAYRQKVIDWATDERADIKWILICADPDVVKKRVSKKREDSEADFEVYKAIRSAFDPVVFDHLVVQSDTEGIEEILSRVIKYVNQ